MSLLDFLDRPIAFHPALVKLGVGVTGALMLGQAIYWTKRTSDQSGWFWKTSTEWEEETGLTRREQDGARARLREAGFIEEAKHGIPARLFFRVNVEAIEAALGGMHQTAKQVAPEGGVCTKPPNSMHQTANLYAPNGQTNTETTQRLLIDYENPAPAKPAKKPKPRLIEKLPVPEWLQGEAWDMWLRHRKHLTPDAHNAHIRFLTKQREAGVDHAKIIEQSVQANWTGLFELKGQKRFDQERYPKGSKHQRSVGVANEIRSRAFGQGHVPNESGQPAQRTIDGVAEVVG